MKRFRKRTRKDRLGCTASFIAANDQDNIPTLEESSIASHYLTNEQLCQVFNTSLENGLSQQRATLLLSINGPNALEKNDDNAYLKIFIHNFFGWFQIMLWIGGLLSISIHYLQQLLQESNNSYEHLYLGVIILLVVIFTGLLAFYQEAKNVRVMKGFNNLMSKTANVLRDGRDAVIPSEELVVGDVVVMNVGEIVPADVKLFEVNGFKIDLSSLTGESLSHSRTTYHTDQNPLETKNLAFSSCLITEGSAKGVVVATGNKTVIGRIAGLVTKLEKVETPIATEIKRFIKIVSGIAIVFGIIFFIMVTWIKSNWMAGFYYMTGIIIANVPEGLLVTFTVALTLTAKKLKTKNCLVKKLQSVETLGAVSVICSDKTGTLTENRMTVSHVSFDLKIFNHDDLNQQQNPVFNQFLLVTSLCMTAEFEGDCSSLPPEEWKIKGDATESAIFRYLQQINSVAMVQNANQKVCEIPFNSTRKYNLTIHRTHEENKYLLIMKGAPEIIINHCNRIMLSEDTKDISKEEFMTAKQLCIQLGQMGERVIGYSFLMLEEFNEESFDAENPNFPMLDYCFLGFLSLIDPPRSSALSAINKCRSAGIKVVMVTGDHPVTALAISRKVGIISPLNTTIYDDAFKQDIDPIELMKTADLFSYSAAVITGSELRALSSEALDQIILEIEEITFARTSPQQKLMIVESCQRVGHVVAVTGDGVNDSPALKKADIGIAMGITGTDVSKEAADMILLDDDFSSIVLGIEEGRLIFDNLKKSIVFTLTSNTPEMIPFVLYATLGIPLALNALLIICINVFTDLWPAISLAYEKSEADIMKKPPRDLVNDRLVNRNLISMAYFQIGVLQTLAALSGYFVAFCLYGFLPWDIIYTRVSWNDEGFNEFKDSYGQEWSFIDRKSLERLAQSTYYLSIVLVQVADVIICKTRRLSIFRQGMCNHMLNLGIAIEIVVSAIIIYVPFFNDFMYTAAVPWQLWLPAMPFAILLFVGDELRKLCIRANPNGLIEREGYW